MNIFDALRDRWADDPDGDDAELAWTIRRSSVDTGYGWSTVEGWERFDEPIDRETFEINVDPTRLKPGTYQLFRLENKQLRKVEDANRWSWTYGEENNDSGIDDELRHELERLEASIQDLRADEEGPRDVPDDPEELLKLLTLNDEEFMRLYGADIALKAWGVHGGAGGPSGYDDYQESPWGALAFDISNNPEHLQAAMRNVGIGIGAAMRTYKSGGAMPNLHATQDDANGTDAETVEERVRGDAEGVLGKTLDDLADGPSTPEEAVEALLERYN